MAAPGFIIPAVVADAVVPARGVPHLPRALQRPLGPLVRVLLQPVRRRLPRLVRADRAVLLRVDDDVRWAMVAQRYGTGFCFW